MNQRQFTAFGGGVSHYGLLRPKPILCWEEILKSCATGWTNESQRARIGRITGCLDKLSASLMQVYRMRLHHNELVQTAFRLAGQEIQVASFRGEEAIADFENLLLQGRSALDRLTWFVTELTGHKSSNFRSLKTILANLVRKDPQARELVEILDETLPWFDSVFAKIESPEALRDLVGHKHSLLEGLRNCFSVAFVTPSQAAIFDCEIQLPGDTGPRAIMRLSQESGQYLSFLILNSLSVVIGQPKLSLGEFEPTWENRTVALTDFVISEPDGSPLTENALTLAKRTTPTGFELVTRNIDSSIRSHTIDVTKPQR